MRKIFLFIFIYCAVNYVNAQDATPLTYGIKAGGHVTNNYGPGTNHYAAKPSLGFQTGIYAKYDIMEKLSIQQEALLTGRGLRAQYASSSNQEFGYVGLPYSQSQYFLGTDAPMQRVITTQTDVYYLDLPLSAHYKVIPNVNAHAGIMYSRYLFNTKLSHTYNNGSQDNLKQPDENYLRALSERGDFERFEKNQFGVFVGGSYHFDFGVEAGARYNIGLTRINKPVRAGRDLQYSMLQVFVAYDLSRIF